MPTKRIGNIIYHQVGGKWLVKQRCTSLDNAKKAFALLKGLESGSIKPSEVGKPKRKKKR